MQNFTSTKILQALALTIVSATGVYARPRAGLPGRSILPSKTQTLFSLDNAVSLAEKIRKAVLDQRIVHEASPTETWVTLSLGVASTTVVLGNSHEDLVKQADNALYTAKRQGRNRVASV